MLRRTIAPLLVLLMTSWAQAALEEVWSFQPPGEQFDASVEGPSTGVLEARWHDSGFAEGDDNYNAVTAASDGKIYYVLCAHQVQLGAQMFVYDPATGRSRHLADLTEASGEKALKAIPQGKSHVPFYESEGKLYFATHLGYYNTEGGKEMVGMPPPGFKPYPGGHFMSYELATGRLERIADAPTGEGIITLSMDLRRRRLFALTWPLGRFLVFDLEKRELQDLGLTAGKGEKGEGSEFRVVCRSIAVDPDQGKAFFTSSAGEVFVWDGTQSGALLGKLTGWPMKRDIFGSWNPDQPGTMGYNWRQMVWYEPEKVFYGVHGNTGYLFRFDPRSEEIKVVDRIASEKSRTGGVYDSFSYGYLGLTLGPDGQTLYYLTGTPAGEEIRFISYHLPTGRYRDHGALVLEDGQRPNWAQAIAVGRDKRIYTVSKVLRNGRQKVDLISFPDPLQSTAKPEVRYQLVRSWMNPSDMPNPLKEAHSLCFDRGDNLLVVDSVGARVHRFTPEGRWLGEIGLGPGEGPGRFQGPRDARVHANGEIYVSDAGHCRIQVFAPDGRYRRHFGSCGSGPGQLLRAHGLDFSPDYKRLYIADVDNNRVSVFDSAGTSLFSFGQKGWRSGDFHDVHGLGVLPNGDVVVSNYYGPAQRFTSEGKFLYDFAPAGFRGWIHFHSMTADHQGNIYLAARHKDGKNAVVMYDARGAFLTAWSVPVGPEEQGIKAATINRDGSVYAAVESRHRHGVQVFRPIAASGPVSREQRVVPGKPLPGGNDE